MFGAALIGTAMPCAAQTDPLAAASSTDPAAASPIRQVTLYVDDSLTVRRFFADAMAMIAGQAYEVSSAAARRAGLTPGATATVFTRPGSEAASVRVLASPAAPPPLRPSHTAQAPGGLAIGMPVADQAARERIVTAAGFTSVVGATQMTLPRGDGSAYTVGEIHYRAPSGVLVLGIDRGTMKPVGPIDPATRIGGPAYASIVVADLPASERFMKDVLRYEKRRDAVFTSAGSKGGLGLPDGQRFAFQQWFAPGSATGYIILMDMLDVPSPPAAGGFSRTGLVMLGFDAAELGAVASRARAAGARIVAMPDAKARSLILAMPDGFLIEVSPRSGAGR